MSSTYKNNNSRENRDQIPGTPQEEPQSAPGTAAACEPQGPDTVEPAPHVGNIIRDFLDKKPRSLTVIWLADQLHCHRRNIYDILSRPSIDVDLLFRLSQILKHDFFADLSAQLPATATE